MPGRSYSFNGYEASLSSPISAGSTSIALDSTAGLQSPGYLVIDPSSPTLREYVYFTGVSGTELTGVSRGLAGSITPGAGVGHDAGIKIRAVPVHQHLDDLWGPDGIEGSNTALSTHEADATPHPSLLTEADANALYLQVDGGNSMDAALAMGTNKVTGLAPGTADTDAATKKQVDDGDAAVTAAFESADATKLDTAGGVMSGAIAMGGSKITGLANGLNAQDAATVAQLGSVDAPTHDGLEGAEGIGEAWADKHHVKYTDAEAVAAVGPHFAGGHANLTGVTASQHHTRYSDAEAVAAGAASYLPILNPSCQGEYRINTTRVLRLSGVFTALSNAGNDIAIGDGIDELYLGGVPFSVGAFNVECDEAGTNRRIVYNTKASSERFKQDIEPSPFEGGECLKWDIEQFRYIKDVESNGDDAKVRHWQIAERLFEKSGEDFIQRDRDGEIQNTDDRAIMADMILTIQRLEARVAELEAS